MAKRSKRPAPSVPATRIAEPVTTALVEADPNAGFSMPIQPVRSAWPVWVSPLVVLGLLLLFAFIRVRLRDFPLERDEGEYAYAGQLILQGIPPYKLAYNMKLPGTYAAYALIMAIFGQTPSGIHLGLLFVNAATIVLMFFLARRLFGELAAVVAAAAYALLSTSVALMGMQAHATHFVALAAVAGLLVLLRSSRGRRPLVVFTSGLLFGLAILMKQPGLFLALFAAVQLVYDQWRGRQPWRAAVSRVGIFVFGIALPLVLTCVLMAICGVFHRFWFWVVDYARAYGAVTSFSDGIAALGKNGSSVVGPVVGIWVLAGAGAAALIWDRVIRDRSFFCLSLLMFSFLAICPGLYFRPHYFILMLPAVALLAAAAVDSFTRLIAQHRPAIAFLPGLLFIGMFCYALFDQSDELFRLDPVSVCRQLYTTEPFPEASEVADYVRSNTDSSEPIAVLGSDPEIYFYAHRHSATGYIYTYPLTEEQPYADRMQQEMFAEIAAARPLYVVMHPPAWIMAGTRGANDRIQWAKLFLKDYDMTALVDRITPETSEFHRRELDDRNYRPHNPLFFIFRRRRN